MRTLLDCEFFVWRSITPDKVAPQMGQVYLLYRDMFWFHIIFTFAQEKNFTLQKEKY